MFNLERGDGQQYLSQIKTMLPLGLLGMIPAVTLCEEPRLPRERALLPARSEKRG